MLQCGCKEIAKYVRYFKKETVMIGSLIVGAFVGQSLFGYWGPTLADMAILPSVLGAIIVIAVVDLFFG